MLKNQAKCNIANRRLRQQKQQLNQLQQHFKKNSCSNILKKQLQQHFLKKQLQ